MPPSVGEPAAAATSTVVPSAQRSKRRASEASIGSFASASPCVSPVGTPPAAAVAGRGGRGFEQDSLSSAATSPASTSLPSESAMDSRLSIEVGEPAVDLGLMVVDDFDPSARRPSISRRSALRMLLQGGASPVGSGLGPSDCGAAQPASPRPSALENSGASSEFRVGSAGGSGRHTLMRQALGLGSGSPLPHEVSPSPFSAPGGSLAIDGPGPSPPAPDSADVSMHDAPCEPAQTPDALPFDPQRHHVHQPPEPQPQPQPQPQPPEVLRVRCGVVVGPEAAPRMAARPAPEFEFQGVPADVPLNMMRASLLRRCGVPPALEPSVCIRYLDEEHDWVLLRRPSDWAICVQTAVSNASRRRRAEPRSPKAARPSAPPLVRLRVEIGLARSGHPAALPEEPAPGSAPVAVEPFGRAAVQAAH
eukprot:tig00020830_g14474.t1